VAIASHFDLDGRAHASSPPASRPASIASRCPASSSRARSVLECVISNRGPYFNQSTLDHSLDIHVSKFKL
jgi:hypothetical protein